jgi:hypothetical protein
MAGYFNENYLKDSIRAVDAKFEAQKIAFSPLIFQAVKAMLETGLLKAISDSAEKGLAMEEAAKKAGLSLYAASVLIEASLGMNIVKVTGDGENARFVLGKTGWFLLEDEMTKVNFNFVNDVCYKGAFDLEKSVRTGKPEGLKVFNGGTNTIYEALSALPPQAKKSWFEFDHFYSDIGFAEALPIVFAGKPKKITDIGGNTARWAILCCEYSSEVEVLIVDLPGQTDVARQKAEEKNFSKRISVFPCNVLDDEKQIPKGADVIWMSQFLDCFSLEEVSRIMAKTKAACGAETDVFVMEPFWDRQRFDAASFSLQATSLYFTCMANGNSKMYRCDELKSAIEKSGFTLVNAHHNLGSNDYSLLHFRKSQ